MKNIRNKSKKKKKNPRKKLKRQNNNRAHFSQLFWLNETKSN